MKGEKNPTLRRDICGWGIPVVAFLDTEGRLVLKCTYPHTVDAWKERAKEAKEYVDLRAKAASGDEKAERAFFLLQLHHGKLDYPEAKKGAARKGFTADQKKKIGGYLLALEALDILKKTGVFS